MTAFTRNTVLQALFNVVSASSGFQATGRKLVAWTEQTSQPALFQRIIGEEFAPLEGYGQPQKKTLHVELWIYAQTDIADTPESVILPLLDALDTALATNTLYDGRQQLGLEGFVDHAWRQGETVISQGETGTQAIIVVPVRVSVIAPFTTS